MLHIFTWRWKSGNESYDTFVLFCRITRLFKSHDLL